jgi:competence protein ComEA
MFKKLLLAIATFIATMGFAFAQVDVNKADQAALDGIKGIGPATSKAIIEERKKGDFKDWADLEKRVKGVGEKNAVKFSQAGLTVNGQAKSNAPAAAKDEKKDKKEKAKADAKPADAAKDAKPADAKKDAKKEESKKEVKKEEPKK